VTLPDLLTATKTVADMGGALVFSAFVAWELRALRAAFERLADKVVRVDVRS